MGNSADENALLPLRRGGHSGHRRWRRSALGPQARAGEARVECNCAASDRRRSSPEMAEATLVCAAGVAAALLPRQPCVSLGCKCKIRLARLAWCAASPSACGSAARPWPRLTRCRMSPQTAHPSPLAPRPTTVLIHGLDSSKETWSGVIADLAKAGYPAVRAPVSNRALPGQFQAPAIRSAFETFQRAEHQPGSPWGSHRWLPPSPCVSPEPRAPAPCPPRAGGPRPAWPWRESAWRRRRLWRGRSRNGRAPRHRAAGNPAGRGGGPLNGRPSGDACAPPHSDPAPRELPPQNSNRPSPRPPTRPAQARLHCARALAAALTALR